MSIDILLVESGNGGEFLITKDQKDIETIQGYQNMIYLGLFGGNVEQSTKTYAVGEQRFDWWGNSLLQQFPNAQMNSRTERLLRESAFTSQTRLEIQQAVIEDLRFMQAFSDLEVFVSFPEIDKVEIRVNVTKPDGELSATYAFLWDATQQELTTNNRYTTI
jgi:hypothetical protein